MLGKKKEIKAREICQRDMSSENNSKTEDLGNELAASELLISKEAGTEMREPRRQIQFQFL